MTTTPDPSTVYRDATYNAETQERLRSLLSVLGVLGIAIAEPPEVEALRDVVNRWDNNEATETILP